MVETSNSSILAKKPVFNKIAVYALLLLLIAPSLIWIRLDQAVWAWDQSGYGQASVDLFYTLANEPGQWPEALLQALKRKPPAIAWAGQFFVPLRMLTGSIEAGLLVSVVIVQFLSLIVMYQALYQLSGGRLLISLAGVMVMASASLFVGLSHQFLVEPLQLLAVSWFILVMSFAPKWDRAFILSQLFAATVFAMLVKTSSPIYCIGPGLLALRYVVWPNPIQRSVTAGKKRTVFFLGVGVLLIVLAIGWYSHNLEAVIRHVSISSTGPVAELYGKSEPFLNSFVYWLGAAQQNFFAPFVLEGVVLIVIAGIIRFIINRQTTSAHFNWCGGIALLQIIFVLAVFSTSPNRDNRYLLPLLPYVSLLMCWVLYQVNIKLITWISIAAFSLQLVWVYSQAFAFINLSPQASTWLQPVSRNPHQSIVLNAIVSRTCNQDSAGQYTVIGVELPWLNSETVSYFASKRRLENHLRCYYIPLGFAQSDPEVVIAAVMTVDPQYFVTLDPDLYPIPADAFNQVSVKILDEARTEKTIAEESPLAEDPAVLFFHRVVEE